MRFFAALIAVALVASACASSDAGVDEPTTTTRPARPANADVDNLPDLSDRPEVPPESRHYQNQEPVGLDAESRARYERFAPYADQLIFEIQRMDFATGWGVGLDSWGALIVIVPTPDQQALAREILGDEVEITTQPIIAGTG
ncbi:MAG: hypothetical protein KJN63_00260 [Acidimicrobiia bacterium]|nr:hypothetical protein [Acidimicrobiia bacterium]